MWTSVVLYCDWLEAECLMSIVVHRLLCKVCSMVGPEQSLGEAAGLYRESVSQSVLVSQLVS